MKDEGKSGQWLSVGVFQPLPPTIVYDTQAVLCSSELVFCQKDGRSSTEHSVVFSIPQWVLDEVGVQAALLVSRSGASLFENSCIILNQYWYHQSLKRKYTWVIAFFHHFLCILWLTLSRTMKILYFCFQDPETALGSMDPRDWAGQWWGGCHQQYDWMWCRGLHCLFFGRTWSNFEKVQLGVDLQQGDKLGAGLFSHAREGAALSRGESRSLETSIFFILLRNFKACCTWTGYTFSPNQ